MSILRAGAENYNLRSLLSIMKNSAMRKWFRIESSRQWRKRHRKVFSLHPEYRKPCNGVIEKKHLNQWKRLRNDVSLDTLRICYNISGKANPDIIPEEVFVSEIENHLNIYYIAPFLSIKNIYNRWFPEEYFPKVFIHNIDGAFYDGFYNLIDNNKLRNIVGLMKFPVVIKPSLFSGGGRNVFFPNDLKELEINMRSIKRNFVIQELIQQDEFFRKFNPQGLNTIRACLYRSPISEKVHFLNAALRMGKGGSLDNETAGGLVCYINRDGTLNNYAVDKYGGKFIEHLDTGIKFCKEQKITDFDKMVNVAKKIAADLYFTRLSSLDMCMDRNGAWRVIEINLMGQQTIRFSQYAGEPFFGPFTQEVIEFCKETSKNIKHKIL